MSELQSDIDDLKRRAHEKPDTTQTEVLFKQIDGLKSKVLVLEQKLQRQMTQEAKQQASSQPTKTVIETSTEDKDKLEKLTAEFKQNSAQISAMKTQIESIQTKSVDA